MSNNPLALVDPTGHMGGGPPITGLAFPSSDAYQTYLSNPALTFDYLGLLPVLVEQINVPAPFDQITPQMGRLQLLNNMLAGTADSLSDAVFPGNALVRQGLNSLVDAQAGLGIDTSSDGYRSGNELLGPMLATAIGVAAGGAAGLEGGAEAAAAQSIRTPYGAALQDSSAEAMAARQAVMEGATLYRGGVLGCGAGPEGQFWSIENPLNPGYAQRYGIPSKNVSFDFVELGTLKPGSFFITRPAPGIGPNAGGGIEVVVNPNSVRLNAFHSR